MNKGVMLLAALLLAGCAPTSLYQWGSYSAATYGTYTTPDKAVELRTQLEQHVLALEGKQLKVAPGMYGDLGTMYLQAGARDKALAYFRKERDAWPESQALMDALIKTVSAKTDGEASKS